MKAKNNRSLGTKQTDLQTVGWVLSVCRVCDRPRLLCIVGFHMSQTY